MSNIYLVDLNFDVYEIYSFSVSEKPIIQVQRNSVQSFRFRDSLGVWGHWRRSVSDRKDIKGQVEHVVKYWREGQWR